MTPKEKAEELYNQFYGQTPTRMDELQIEEDKRFAKQCALIAVEELINDCDATSPFEEQRLKFWNDVKLELS